MFHRSTFNIASYRRARSTRGRPLNVSGRRGSSAAPVFGQAPRRASVPAPVRVTSVEWEYTSVTVDAWMPLAVQGGPKELLRKLGEDGWEAFAVTPATPPPGDGDDPDASTDEILLRRERRS